MDLIAAAPLVALCLLWVLVHGHRERLGLGALSSRGSLVAAYLLLVGLVLAITEAASAGDRLTPGVVGAAWVATMLLLGAAVLLLPSGDRPWAGHRLGRSELAALGLGGAFLLAAAATALVHRPASSDSMMYHLARIAHWEQERSVAPYATHFVQQVEMAPLHEYSMLQLHLLTGADRFDGLVSTLALAIAVVAVAEVARLLGGDRRAQLIAGVVALTMPSAVLQAGGTHNDLFAATIGTCLVVVLLVRRARGPHLGQAALAGLAAGLAVLAKATFLPTMLPAVVALAAVLVVREVRTAERRPWVRLAAAGGVGLVVAALAAGPFLAQNAELTGSVLGSDPDNQQIEDPTVAVTAANTFRHLAGNYRIGDGEPGVQTAVAEVVLRAGWRAFDATGVAFDDQRYAMGFELDAFELTDHSRHQRTSEYGANPWHFLLAVVVTGSAFAALVRRRAVNGDRWLVWCRAALAAGLVVGFVAMAGLLRWQMYATRFQIGPLLVLAALTGIAMARWRRPVAGVVLGALVLSALPMLLSNTERPLLGDDPRRIEGDDAEVDRYVIHPDGEIGAADYDAVAVELAASGCDRLGLGNLIQFEYPLWVALELRGWEGTVAGVDVQNDTASAADEGFVPCAVVRQVPGGLELELLG